jgi:hypothetical protein
MICTKINKANELWREDAMSLPISTPNWAFRRANKLLEDARADMCADVPSEERFATLETADRVFFWLVRFPPNFRVVFGR